MKYLFLIFIFHVVSGLKAQISFPGGNVNNLVTNEAILYLETRILFHTGTFKADDYRWEKKYDSLDSRWLVTACFNGDCKNDLLQSGDFIKDYGLNDTTCFIAFHVESNGYEGTSKIKYNVYNKNQPGDSASLYFNITYSNFTGVPDHSTIPGLMVYPNPAGEKLNIALTSGNLNGTRVFISDLSGRNLKNMLITHDTRSYPLLLDELLPGIYIVTIQNQSGLHTLKIARQ